MLIKDEIVHQIESDGMQEIPFVASFRVRVSFVNPKPFENSWDSMLVLEELCEIQVPFKMKSWTVRNAWRAVNSQASTDFIENEAASLVMEYCYGRSV